MSKKGKKARKTFFKPPILLFFLDPRASTFKALIGTNRELAESGNKTQPYRQHQRSLKNYTYSDVSKAPQVCPTTLNYISVRLPHPISPPTQKQPSFSRLVLHFPSRD